MPTKDIHMESVNITHTYCFLHQSLTRGVKNQQINQMYSLGDFTRANKLWLQGAFLVM